jgi:hypothetical protein
MAYNSYYGNQHYIWLIKADASGNEEAHLTSHFLLYPKLMGLPACSRSEIIYAI